MWLEVKQQFCDAGMHICNDWPIASGQYIDFLQRYQNSSDRDQCTAKGNLAGG